MKNILVTGGAGFIGSHLCDALVSENHVIALDNFLGGSQENIAHLLPHPNFVFLKQNVNDLLELERLPELKKFKIKGIGIQEVYHLASPTSPKQFERLRKEILTTNSLGTLNVLELAKKYTAKFLLTSSSVVYGPRNTATASFEETVLGCVDSVSSRACYDEGKRFAEAAAATYQQVDGLEVKIARLGRVYGPRMPIADGHMIPDFILQAMAGKPLTIYGDGKFSTALLSVSDCVEALKRFMAAGKEVEVLNVASEDNHAIADVAATIITLVGSSSKIVYEKPLLFMTELPMLDITRAKESMEWFPIVNLEEGLKQTIEYTKATKGVLHKY